MTDKTEKSIARTVARYFVRGLIPVGLIAACWFADMQGGVVSLVVLWVWVLDATANASEGWRDAAHEYIEKTAHRHG